MARRSTLLPGRTVNAAAAVEMLLHGLSAYAVPVAIAVVTFIAFASWERQYPVGTAIPLDLRVLEQTGDALDPAQAIARLKTVAAVAHYDTRLSESPFWFSFTLHPSAGTEPIEVELPSRHAVEAACWASATGSGIGHANRLESAGRMRPLKAGFAFAAGASDAAAPIVCRAMYSGPARISAVQWPETGLQASIAEFNRNAGLLDGGLIVLSLFVLVTAAINREWRYVLFAAWLLASLRLGAISAGWDTQWFERTVPPQWLFAMRKLTIAAYYVLTYTLFRRLFQDDLKRLGHSLQLQILAWSCLALLVASVTLPFSKFLPVMWTVVGVGAITLAFLLARIVRVSRSRVAMWYSASLAIVLLSGLYEVVAASLGVKVLIGSVNSVTAALSSSLMVALAIAEQMRQERQERMQAQAELHATYEAIPIGLFTLDRDSAFVRVNPALKRMLGVDPSRGKREYWSDCFEPGACDRLQDIVRRGVVQEVELRSTDRDGRGSRWYLVKAVPDGERVEGSLQDITEQYEATERLRFLAENDSLTGVLNRRGIEKILEAATGRLADGKPLALAYLDLDRFKLINDLFGHVTGDDVLRQVCRRIACMLSEGQSIGRIGGDEFIIIFQRTPIRSATAICRGIIEAIGGAPYQTGDRAFQVKGSIGLIEVAAGAAVKDAISMADRACRVAKTGQHAGLTVYERDATAFMDRERELRLVAQLGEGVAPEGLFFVMQPIMSLRSPHESLNFEILIRMREADGSVTPAAAIIAAAESNGRAAVIDRWVLRRALEWVDLNHESLSNTRFVCMNLSGASLNDEKFVEDAVSMLGGLPRAARRLCIEITEGVALHDLENTKRFIDRVRNAGAKVALDDFGAGYTSFSYLRELPADALKIDGSFVRDAISHPANLAIIQAIVELARNLGMASIAEWAEDRATVEALAEAGVDYVQGYAIARPQDPDKVLCADSSASFIEDPDVAHFVRTVLASADTLELWDPRASRAPLGLH